jgi:pimeloyl-ACP methyl ester carboxylesterase
MTRFATIRRLLTGSLILFAGFSPLAQVKVSFTEGLASGRVHQYGREAVFTDTLMHQITERKLLDPLPGNVWFDQDGITKRWVAVKADSSGYFRHPALQAGYLRVTHRAVSSGSGLLTVTGNAMVYVNGEPHAGDPYNMGWMHIPVQLKKGNNEFLVRTGFSGRTGGVKISLEVGGPPVRLLAGDATLPFLVRGITNEDLLAGIVCVNATGQGRSRLQVEAVIGQRSRITEIPGLMPFVTRKVPVSLPLPSRIGESAEAIYRLRLLDEGKVVDSMSLAVPQVDASQHQAHTFISRIDGSVQYYGVAPQAGGAGVSPALYLSVHGAGVEAIGQAKAYRPKPEGPIVTPTNRRPRGFNWEDWGRIDAMEVLEIAKNKYKPDPSRLYLTGHSMGGHGTWFLGATYAGLWAAIAPCAGYPVLQSYGSADGKIPVDAQSPAHQMLLRASNPSNVLALAKNYGVAGVYIHHGDDDRVVSVDYARQMRKVLGEFHPDFAYYEYPGGSHWFGDISVDWPPLFSFLNTHRNRQSTGVQTIDFSTAAPAISSQHYWVAILQQQRSLAYSRLKLSRDSAGKTISGTTENIRVLALKPDVFRSGERISIDLDGYRLFVTVSNGGEDIVLMRSAAGWVVSALPPASEKGIHRGAGFKDAFDHRMIFVYGTKGTAEENRWSMQKARYDAESWYYRGNGAVDVIADVAYEKAKHSGRGVIIYGNAQTNALYEPMMRGCEVRLERGKAIVGEKVYSGDAFAGCILWPSADDPLTSVAVIGGTGLKGMRAAESNQYFAGGSGFPDFMIFSSAIHLQGAKALVAAGFYDHAWRLSGDHVAE